MSNKHRPAVPPGFKYVRARPPAAGYTSAIILNVQLIKYSLRQLAVARLHVFRGLKWPHASRATKGTSEEMCKMHICRLQAAIFYKRCTVVIEESIKPPLHVKKERVKMRRSEKFCAKLARRICISIGVCRGGVALQIDPG